MLSIFIYLCFVKAEIIGKIDQLPSYPYKWYGGYLGPIYYLWFESQRNPSSDPVVIWLQGGPACSSLFGAFYEIGPFQFEPLSNTTYLNPYAWNKIANLLFLELPQGVGFSQQSQYQNDASYAQDALDAINEFFKQYPTYKTNEFYIAGESYGGIYIPYVANWILNQNTNTINLKGVLIGNGCTLGSECTDFSQQPIGISIFQFEHYFNRGFFSLEERKLFEINCKLFTSMNCINLQRKLMAKIQFSRVDINNLLKQCYHNDPLIQSANGEKQRIKPHQFNRQFKHLQQSKELYCDFEYGDYFFFNNETVQNILHAHHQNWGSCSNSLKYTEDKEGSYRFYSQFLHKGLKILIYSGDVDSNVPIVGTLEWIQKLVEDQNLTETQPWTSWWVQGKQNNEPQVGGFTWEFNNTLRFVSVKGAGHEVPFWKPFEAYVMFEKYMSNAF